MKKTSDMLAGYGEADITPRIPCDLNGFAARQQPCVSVAAPIMARVLLLRSGRNAALIAVCDLLGFTTADSAALESGLAEAANVPLKNVLLCCTHTHSGPMSMPLGLVGRFRPGYLKKVRAGLVRAARNAAADLSQILEARFGTTSIRGLAQFRCAKEDPGRGRDAWPGRLTALRLERQTTPITLVHAGIHPYLLSWKRRVMHPDFPGPLCDSLARSTKGHALFLPGCGADVQAEGALSMRISDVENFGSLLASAAEKALEKGRAVSLAPFKGRRLSPTVKFTYVPETASPLVSKADGNTMTLGERKFEANHRLWLKNLAAGRLPRSGRFPMQILRIGDLLFAGLAAEVFHDTGADLSRALRNRDRTLVVSHCGGNVGYLPRPFSYRHGTYESSNAHEWYGWAGALASATEENLRQMLALKSNKFC